MEFVPPIQILHQPDCPTNGTTGSVQDLEGSIIGESHLRKGAQEVPPPRTPYFSFSPSLFQIFLPRLPELLGEDCSGSHTITSKEDQDGERSVGEGRESNPQTAILLEVNVDCPLGPIALIS